jgi:Cu2+-exporting ATPase
LAQAISRSYESEILNIEGVMEEKGQGLEGKWDGKSVKLGSRRWCEVKDGPEDAWQEVWFVEGANPPVRFIFEDEVRAGAEEVIKKLSDMHFDIAVISGDREKPVAELCHRLSIKEYYAQQLPNEKYEYLTRHKDERILMVGDGLNDAPALSFAHASMSPCSAIDIAQNSADIVFQGGIDSVPTAILVGKKTMRVVKENLSISLLYNIIAVPCAVLGWVTPLWAAIFMSLSSICVILNSLKIK